MITVAALMACGISAPLAAVYEAPLAYACDRFAINTGARQAAFATQCAHESGDLARLEEMLNYTTPARIVAVWPRRVTGLADAATLCRNPEGLANRVYAGRNGNAGESSGDGWTYRGRGLIQLTGRANYRAAAEAIGEPYEAQPELVLQPAHAALTAAWFWAAGGCNELADVGNIEAVTRKINGPAMAGLDDRRRRFERARGAFG